MRRSLAAVDRWDVLTLCGAGLLAGGVWAQWGAPWACMLSGGMMLGTVAIHAWRAGGAR